MRILFCFGSLILVVVSLLAEDAGASITSEAKQQSTTGETPSQVVRILESCPAWSSANANKREIIASLQRLSTNQTSVLRSGIEQFVAKCQSENAYDVGNMSKLFVLNRFVFSVPERDRYDGPFFGGWEGIPHDQKEMRILWPLSHAKDGQLQLTGTFAGYSGHLYLAVQEFDYFLKKYGRRPQTTVSKPN